MTGFKNSLLLFSVVILSSQLICVAAGQTNPPASDQATTIQFPEDRSLGILYAAPLDVQSQENFYWFNPEFVNIGFALGKVEIPANSLVRLDVTRDACSDLSPLSQIPQDSIQGLYFNTDSDPTGQFDHIGKLTGLRFLSFRSVPLSDGRILKLAGLTNLEQFDCEVYGHTDEGFGINDRALMVIARFKKLKRLNLRGNPVTDDCLRLLESCQALEILGLDGTKVTGEGFDHLLNLPNLKILSLGAYENGAPVDDKGMAALCQMRQITNLSLNGTKVTDAGMKNISGMEKLEHLGLDFTDVTEDGLAFLAGMENLKSIGFQKKGGTVGLGDKAAEQLSKVPNLESVRGQWNLTGAGFEHLAKLKKIRALDFMDNVTDENLNYISTMTSLENLTLQRCPITDQGVEQLASLKNLKNLCIFRSQMTGAGLGSIQQFPNLEHLAIEFVQFGPDANWKSLGDLSQLTSLTIMNREFGKTACLALARLKSLEHLQIESRPLGPGFFEAVSGLTNLVSLDFYVSNVDAESYRKLAGLKNLEYLNLSGNITDQQLMLLADMPSLRSFQNHSKLLTLAGIEEFTKKSRSLQSFLHPLVRGQ